MDNLRKQKELEIKNKIRLIKAEIEIKEKEIYDLSRLLMECIKEQKQ